MGVMMDSTKHQQDQDNPKMGVAYDCFYSFKPY